MIPNNLWTEKFRPKTVDDYVWINDEQKDQVTSWITEKEIPHLLLSGGPGCGKSSLGRMLMRELKVDPSDIKVVNASKETGIDYLRATENFIETMPTGDFKYVILEEADRLSKQAQDMLKDLIEEYSSVCRWILTTNRPHMISAPLHSRMQGFHVTSLDREQFLGRVATILIEEGINLEGETIEILDEYVTATYPDLRKCLNSLQQNCKTGELKRPNGSSTASMGEYMVQAVALFKTGKIHEARKIICANATEADYEEIYRLLYRNLEWWGNDENSKNKAIVIIANRLKDHSLVADPEINMAACLIELSML